MILLAALMSLFLAAMDSTVTGTLLPAIKADMQDDALYPWLMSGFILATILATPLAGKMADWLGARTTMLVALGTFLLGSAAVCWANTMGWLVAARALQGVGAGAVSVTTYIIVGKLYSDRERGKMQGVLSIVWGLAAIIGPLAGALITQRFGWRPVFAINIPLTMAAMFMIATFYPAKSDKAGTASTLDPLTVLLFSVSLAGILLFIMKSTDAAVSSNTVWLAAIVTAALIGQFLRIRGNPARSVIPVAFVSRGSYVNAALLTMLASIALYASVAMLPLYLQHIAGANTLTGGLVVMAAALGWVVGSAVCGGVLNRAGYKVTGLIGALLLTLGAGLLALPVHNAPIYFFGVAQALLGLGIGFVATTTLVMVQNVSPLNQLGVYTSAIHLCRNIGAAIGINIVAAVQISRLHAIEGMPSAAAYAESFQYSFRWLFVMTAISVFFALALRGRVSRDV